MGAFSVGSMEMLLGAVQAAEAADTPIILQIAEKRLGHSPAPDGADDGQRSPRPRRCPWRCSWTTAATRRSFARPWRWASRASCTTARACPWPRTSPTPGGWWPVRALGASVEAEIGSLGAARGGPEGRSAYSGPAEARAGRPDRL